MPSESNLTGIAQSGAQHAVEHAQRMFAVALDYSPESVQKVEEILGSIFEARRTISDKSIAILADMYGSYVGEAVRRAVGGEWYVDERFGPGLRKGDRKMWPLAKVHKRLVNGGEDNVWVYFQAAVDEYFGPEEAIIIE